MNKILLSGLCLTISQGILINQSIPMANAAATIHIIEDNQTRTIIGNGLANHATGKFPNKHNPNTIKRQSYTFLMPLKPKKNSRATNSNGWIFGIALNGVPFDPGTAETWNNDRRWRMEAINGPRNLGLDKNNAHVQPNGAYHYHGKPQGLIDKLAHQPEKPLLLGYAADGFPIYNNRGYVISNDKSSPLNTLTSSYQLKIAQRQGGPSGKPNGSYTRDFAYVKNAGDLDQCNGREGVTPEYPDGTYYYVITDQFPFVPRCWMGSPDSSFDIKRHNDNRRQQSPNNRGMHNNQPPPPFGRKSDEHRENGRRPPFGGPPPEAFEACEGKQEDSHCVVHAPHGDMNGRCQTVHNDDFVCVPDRHRRH